ncbi:MAG: hypothetical protein QXI37_03460 [Thermoprotei archaeon]
MSTLLEYLSAGVAVVVVAFAALYSLGDLAQAAQTMVHALNSFGFFEHWRPII